MDLVQGSPSFRWVPDEEALLVPMQVGRLEVVPVGPVLESVPGPIVVR